METQEFIAEKLIGHPLEGVLDIEAESTLLPMIQRETALVPHTSYDEKDIEIEGQLQEIFDAAMISYETQQQAAEITDPRYAARTGEVANQFLGTALGALTTKVVLKKHKDDHTLKSANVGTPKKVNNNLFVGNRNDLLRALQEAKSN